MLPSAGAWAELAEKDQERLVGGTIAYRADEFLTSLARSHVADPACVNPRLAMSAPILPESSAFASAR